MLSVKDSLLLKMKKHEKYQICVMVLVSHPGIALILFGRSVIQPICLFDVFNCLYPFIRWLKIPST